MPPVGFALAGLSRDWRRRSSQRRLLPEHAVQRLRRGQPIDVVNPEVLARAPTPGDAAVEALILDLLEWIGSGARPYGEVMEAWRTSCLRLPVWEEAGARGYLERNHAPGGVAEVRVSEAGAAYLRARRKTPG